MRPTKATALCSARRAALPERLERLRSALATARGDAPVLATGDALETLAEVAAEAPTGATLVVASLGTAVYLPSADRARLPAAIAAVGARAVTFEARSALPVVAERWQALVAEGRADADAGFLLALDGEPIASGSPHGDRLASVRVRSSGRSKG